MTKVKSARLESKRPLWICPKCGHRFVTANIWHSCSRYPLSHHFKGRDPIVRDLFESYLSLVESFGPVTVIPQKTRIAFQVRVRFAGAVTRKSWLDCALWLKRRADHPLFYKTESLGTLGHIYRFRLTGSEQLRDKKLQALLREAYAVGCQEDVSGER
jgi:hypothetical protein